MRRRRRCGPRRRHGNGVTSGAVLRRGQRRDHSRQLGGRRAGPQRRRDRQHRQRFGQRRVGVPAGLPGRGRGAHTDRPGAGRGQDGPQRIRRRHGRLAGGGELAVRQAGGHRNDPAGGGFRHGRPAAHARDRLRPDDLRPRGGEEPSPRRAQPVLPLPAGGHPRGGPRLPDGGRPAAADGLLPRPATAGPRRW